MKEAVVTVNAPAARLDGASLNGHVADAAEYDIKL